MAIIYLIISLLDIKHSISYNTNHNTKCIREINVQMFLLNKELQSARLGRKRINNMQKNFRICRKQEIEYYQEALERVRLECVNSENDRLTNLSLKVKNLENYCQKVVKYIEGLNK